MTRLIVGAVATAPSAGKLGVVLAGSGVKTTVLSTWQVTSATVGSQVLVAQENGQSWAIAVVGVQGGATPTPTPADTSGDTSVVPPEQQTTVTGSKTVPPSWTGSFRSGAWRSDTQNLIQGDWSGRGRNYGAAFFPSLKAYGTLTAAQLRLRRISGGQFAAVAPTMVLLSGGKGASWPSTLATAAGPSLAVGDAAWWQVPSGWLAQLSSGAAGGIGIAGTTYCVLDGSGTQFQFDWQRSN